MGDLNEQLRITTSDNAVALVAKANATAVSGVSTEGFGVEGRAHGTGVVGVSEAWLGVYGESTGGNGVDAVRGQGKGSTCGVAGHSENGIGVYGKGPLWAAKFEGKVQVTGALEGKRIQGTTASFSEDITAWDATISKGLSTHAIAAFTGTFTDVVKAKQFKPTGNDYAETFASEDNFEPGTVLTIGDDGLLTPCSTQYDTRATGVVSGAGGFTPGTVMESNSESRHHVIVALAGQVYVKADPQYGPISVGDLLTTSPTLGCAMRVADRSRAVGSILGKAMSPLAGRHGLVRMLVTPS
ncbi:hypothetical protein [Streptomyces sp. NPDC048349]|uniref:hypothetical protein n=1 Tax=Streptomyces sp. NPDC048349 TaxID=3155486 RepID=UPI00344A2ECD